MHVLQTIQLGIYLLHAYVPLFFSFFLCALTLSSWCSYILFGVILLLLLIVATHTMSNISHSFYFILCTQFLLHSFFFTSFFLSPHIAPDLDYPILSSFSPTTADEVRSLILSSSNSSCALLNYYIITSWRLKSCLDSLLPPITTP